VLAQAPLSQSSAALVLECAPLRMEAECQTVLSGMKYEVRRGSQRMALAGARKPPASSWTAAAGWTAAGAWQSGERA
jgi:hypothetical protein